MSFASLGLSEPIVRAVAEQGYTTPTPIQLQAIPAVLSGGDLMAGAQTGTGKTAGFTLPILQRLSVRKPAGRLPIRCLVLTPTRELAAQVEESVRVYGKYVGLKSTVIFGGVGQQPQVDRLRSGVDILVATPGRLLDLHQQRLCDLSQIEILVLDEADRMLDMGFIHDIKKVLKILPLTVNNVKRQNLLFSATFSEEIKTLADGLLNKPALIQVTPPNSTVDMIKQKVHPVDRDKKREMLTHLIRKGDWHQVLVFSRTKHGANRLAEQLDKDGITALAIHGNKSQGARTRALAEFKDGSLQVLVATDIAARGIDIDQLPHVVNYDLPNVPEDYVHRIGRTGRAGATGEAISLVCVDEHAFLRDIERLIKREIESEVIPGFEPDPTARPEPILQRQGRGGATQGRRPAAGGGRSGQAPARSAQPAGRGPGNGSRGRSAGQPAPAGGRPRTSGSGSHATPARASQSARAAQPAQPAARPAAAPQRHNAPRRGGALLGGK